MIAAAHLAVDLHRVLDGVLDQVRRVGLRERAVRQRRVVAQPLPQLLGQVRGQRRDHQHERLDRRARHRSRCSLVRWLVYSISLAAAVLLRSAA